MAPQRLEVWHQHQRLADFPLTHTFEFQDDALVILDAQGVEVARYAPGDYSAVGTEIVCAYIDADDGCPRCHPAAAAG